MYVFYKEWLQRAYQSDDPCKTLFQLIDEKNIKVSAVTLLISDVRITSTIKDEEHPQYTVQDTIKEFNRQIDTQKPSTHTLKSCFYYFSTCMSHLWLDPHDKPGQINAYVSVNEPLPYVWLNIDENLDLNVELIKYTLNEDEFDPLDIIVHTCRGPRIPLVTVKLSIDLVTKEIISACNGNFMQLAVRLDEHRAYLQSPMKGKRFIVVLTYNNVIHGVYYNDGVNNRADPCMYCCHY